jgi:Ca-activated chloride channel family protein
VDDAMVKAAFRYLGEMSLLVQTSIATVLAAAVLIYLVPANGTFVDLWLTHDQQGRHLYEAIEYEAAAERFEDLSWKGTAQFRSGDYAGAAGTWARIGTAEAFFNRGNAHMRAREYRRAIGAYELAVAEAPGWLEAEENLALARYTLEYIERTREQSDTGEESGIGADDIVYDNTGERGAETEVTRESAVEAQSAEKWMRSVDTETADFLRSRFLLEASRAGRL